ncbi:MAG: hypothetical protein ACFB0G_23740 [Leptolyngbyaceae cyanobacterium]
MGVVESLARSPLMTGNRRRDCRIPHGKKSRNPASWAAAKASLRVIGEDNESKDELIGLIKIVIEQTIVVFNPCATQLNTAWRYPVTS